MREEIRIYNSRVSGRSGGGDNDEDGGDFERIPSAMSLEDDSTHGAEGLKNILQARGSGAVERARSRRQGANSHVDASLESKGPGSGAGEALAAWVCACCLRGKEEVCV